MKAPNYSIITCVSDFDVYNSCLLSSLEQFENNDLYEVIPIDNRNKAYTASAAINLGLKIAHSDIIICCHQDVTLLPRFFDILSNHIKNLKRNKKWKLIGCAGRRYDPNRTDFSEGDVGIVFNGPPGYKGQDFELALERPWNGMTDLTEVHCVDECLFIINNSHDDKLVFDTNLKGFHFYGVDYSIQARQAGYKVYAAYLPIIHHGAYSSSLIVNQDYWYLYKDLISKWIKVEDRCFGTHMHWRKRADGIKEISSYIVANADTHRFRAKILYSTINEKLDD